MSENPAFGPELPKLHQVLDQEVAQATDSRSPSTPLDPELQAYLMRLKGLREAVQAMEDYEESLGEM